MDRPRFATLCHLVLDTRRRGSLDDLQTEFLPARWDIVDFIKGLIAGDTGAWIAFAAIAGCILFFILYKQVTGKDFVKSKEERREARKRRKHVLWEYKRDD